MGLLILNILLRASMGLETFFFSFSSQMQHKIHQKTKPLYSHLFFLLYTSKSSIFFLFFSPLCNAIKGLWNKIFSVCYPFIGNEYSQVNFFNLLKFLLWRCLIFYKSRKNNITNSHIFIMMVNFIHQLVWATVPRYLANHILEAFFHCPP